MSVKSRLVAMAAVGWALAACETREITALNREIERLRNERDELTKVAANLDPFRDETKRIAGELARNEAMGALLDHPKRVDRAAAVAGVIRTSQGAGLGWELTGVTTDDSLRRVREQAGTLAVDSVQIDAAGWTLHVPPYDYQAPFSGASPPVVEIPPATPAPGRFAGKRSTALRAEIDRLRKEVAALEHLAKPRDDLERNKRDLATVTVLLASPSRLLNSTLLAERLFVQEGSPCRTGRLAITQDAVRLFCAPRAKDPDAGADALRARVDAGGEWRLGPLSIDASSPEPLQGSLIRAR